MSYKCNVCDFDDVTNIYQFKNKCVTSICTEKNQDSKIYFCNNCSQIMTEPLEDIGDYYADSYNINAESEDEDQLLKIVDGKKIYRYEYQAKTLAKKINLMDNSDIKIIDFGAAKSSTLRKVHNRFPNIKPSVFDVSENYRVFWEKFVPKENQFINSIPEKFDKYFDIVCSFFMLEHVENPLDILRKKYSLLKPEGTVYFVVPNLYKNMADLLVLDHVNHFSTASLKYLMERAGFVDVVIDDQINDGWFVVTGTKSHSMVDKAIQPNSISNEELESNFKQATKIADYWGNALNTINDFNTKDKFSIYGAGFYGSYIAINLPDGMKPSYFIDQNSFLQGKEIHGIKVIAPGDLPEGINQVIVGLNPLAAQLAINSIDCWKDRNINYTYLFSTNTC